MKNSNDKPLFTKAELKDYIEERGYVISPHDLENMYLWYEVREFCYVHGGRRYKLKNWKADILLKCRTGKFNIRKKEKPKPVEKEPEIIPATAEQKAEFHKQFKALINSKKMEPIKLYENRGRKLMKVKEQIEHMNSA